MASPASGADAVRPTQNAPATLAALFAPHEIEQLARLGVHSLADLLCYAPYRYEDRREFTPVAMLEEGAKKQLVKGRIVSLRGGKILRAVLEDAHGDRVRCVFYHYSRHHTLALQGGVVCLQGNVRRFEEELELAQPQILKPGEYGRIVPYYQKKRGISMEFIAACIAKALAAAAPEDLFLQPDAPARQAHALLPVAEALREIHQPGDLERLSAAIRTMKFIEIYDRIGRLLQTKAQRRDKPGVVVEVAPADITRMAERLPYTMSPSQQAAIEQVRQALAQPWPARMLLIGGVGSGKSTICHMAARASVYGARDGRNKVLILAPTKILATQLYQGIVALFGEEIDIHLAVHKGSAVPDADVYVGTTGLFAKQINWRKVGLVVIDEEHRFGKKAKFDLVPPDANLLLMTATPLPRTISLYLYGEMDVVYVKGTPRARQVATYALRRDEARLALQAVQQTIEAGRKAIVIYEAMKHSKSVEDLPLGETCLFVSPRFGSDAAVLLHDGIRDVEEFKRLLQADPDLVFEDKVRLTRINRAFDARKLFADPAKTKSAFPLYAYDAAHKDRVSAIERPQQCFQLSQGRRRLMSNDELLDAMRHGYFPHVPLIRESQLNKGMDIASALPSWRKRFPDKVVYVHGGMSDDEQEAAIQRFKSNERPLLVSTTVVEVGLDVEGTDTVVVANAAKLGIASLTQIRGRVGRHGRAGRCYLLAQGDEEEMARLQRVAAESDDFKLAEMDLLERGWGALHDDAQSGRAHDRFFKIQEDFALLAGVRELWLQQRETRSTVPAQVDK